MSKYTFGVDVGGTSVKLGLFEENGKLIKKWSIATDKSCGGKNIIPHIAYEIEKMLSELGIEKSAVEGAGICVPGPVDKSGLVRGCVNLGWGNKRAADELEDITAIRCRALNDADAAGLGEAVYGHGGKYGSVVMVTIGTGVGGAVIHNGHVLAGSRGNAGEIGHFKVNIDETEKCSCGKCGCLEQYASATGILKFVKDNIYRFENSTLNSFDGFTVKDIAACAKNGDMLSLMAFDRAGKYIALGLSYMAGAVDPDAFILGGGVSRAGNVIFEPVKKYFGLFSFNTECEAQIIPALLGNDAGIYGASEFVKNRGGLA
ncbi:ROK family protein [Lachnospiraceae bacterium NSJ-143]|nr:ROK family protein [Lachnospiraceae bacterium NSJ-143]